MTESVCAHTVCQSPMFRALKQYSGVHQPIAVLIKVSKWYWLEKESENFGHRQSSVMTVTVTVKGTDTKFQFHFPFLCPVSLM